MTVRRIRRYEVYPRMVLCRHPESLVMLYADTSYYASIRMASDWDGCLVKVVAYEYLGSKRVIEKHKVMWWRKPSADDKDHASLGEMQRLFNKFHPYRLTAGYYYRRRDGRRDWTFETRE